MKTKLNWSPQAYRLLFNFVATITLIPGVLILKSIGQISYSEFDIAIVVVGTLLGLLGLSIIIIALTNYDLLAFSGLGKEKPNEKLRVNGLNKHVRHPLYSGIFLLVWGIYIGMLNWNFLIIAVVTSAYIYIGTRLEERKLIEQFGTDYEGYMKRVPMFFPNRKA